MKAGALTMAALQSRLAAFRAGRGRPPSLSSMLRALENHVSSLFLLAMVVLPVSEMVLRGLMQRSIEGTTDYVQHCTLWVAFLGAVLASREQSHLSFATGATSLPGWLERARGRLVIAGTLGITICLGWAGLEFVSSELESPHLVGSSVPVALAESIIPLAFAGMAIHLVAGVTTLRERVIVALVAGLLAGAAFALMTVVQPPVWWYLAGIVVAGLLGLPIFAVLGSAALVLLAVDDIPIAAIPVETYRIVVSPTIPAIPLFTLAGFVLAAGNASTRLVGLFRALLGWMPGGLVVATTLVCAFFSTFTGASGVTILALGGLLLPILREHGHGQRFSLGLVTSTGSIGLLFPPSLAVIMYGVVAQVPINDIFRAGVLPGVLMVAMVCVFGLYRSRGDGVPREPFDLETLLRAIWIAKWEVLLPVVVVWSIFGGYATLIEAAAICASYTLVVELFIHRDIRPLRDLPQILVRCVTMLGGIFVILGVAMGLTSYLVDAMIPMRAAEWIATHIESRVLFLIALNLFLIVVGCLMDIFSAILVVVPLIIPMSEVFDIHPLHLAMIFLVNLELGYLTPPVGMNLFLASYRLKQPLLEIYRSTLPFLLVLLIVLLLITYVPALTIGAA